MKTEKNVTIKTDNKQLEEKTKNATNTDNPLIKSIKELHKDKNFENIEKAHNNVAKDIRNYSNTNRTVSNIEQHPVIPIAHIGKNHNPLHTSQGQVNFDNNQKKISQKKVTRLLKNGGIIDAYQCMYYNNYNRSHDFSM